MSDFVPQVLDLAVEIQQIPAPPFGEFKRSAFIGQTFGEAGLTGVAIDSLGNVYGRLPGGGPAGPVLVSAHLDTVFPQDTDLSLLRTSEKITGPGIGDNSLGVAGLLGLVWALRDRQVLLPGDLWLVANVGEEGPGDLRGMRAVVERFGDSPLAYIILEGLVYGQIYRRGLGVRRYRIDIETQGGHSWGDFGRPSAIHELASLISRLTLIPLPTLPRSTLNVGVIQGGTSVNTIASHAHLELDLRSEEPKALEKLIAKVEALLEKSNQPGVKIQATLTGDRPPGQISPDHPLVKLASKVLEGHGLDPQLNIGSTDANIPLSRGFPAICIGLTTGGGAHTASEFIHIKPLAMGLEQLMEIVQGAFQTLG